MVDGIYVIDTDFRVQYMNDVMIRIFGQGVGRKCFQLINRKNEVCPWCRAEEVFAGNTIRWEHHTTSLDQTYEIIEFPLRDSERNISKVSIFRDITPRKRREEKLKASEQDYRRLFEHVGVGVYISSKEGKFLDANKALLDMLGYESKEEFLEIDIARDLYVRPEDRRKFQEIIERYGRVIDYEVDFKRKDGTPIPVLHTGHVRYDQHGKILGYEGINVDQSQRKEMEKNLKKTQDFLEKIIHSSMRAIVAADMNGLILLMNESAKKLFGYADKEIANKLLATDGYTREVARDIMEKLRSPDHGGVGKLDSMVMEVTTSSGEKIPVEMTGSIIYEEGQEIATMAMFKDLRPEIEAEKRLEKTRIQLVQAEKLASIGRLAAGVAHEINNPLGGILMYSSLALEDLPGGSTTHENLQKAVTQAERCKHIVKGLLDFSRQGEPEFKLVSVNEIIEEILSLLETHALFQDIEVVNELDPHLPKIMADKSQLQQVFMNLAINAAEAMEKGGKLIVNSSGGRTSVLIEFSDTGCGIGPQDRGEIFEPFFTTKSARNGSGLGLAVSHGIIARHGGTLSFESKLNEGTTFTVTMPLP
jgi:two-component system NtrC family sensor kinase